MSKFRLAQRLPTCARAERRDVVLGAQQARLLGAPEREAQLLARLDAELGHLLGDLEDRRGAAAVVVDARALDDGVEVRADDQRLRRVARSGSDAITFVVGRVSDAVEVNTCTVTSPAGRLVELRAVGVARADDRDRDLGPAERAGEQVGAARVALVEDDHGVIAGGLGVARLDDEVAAAALDQRDRGPAPGAGEVARLAAGRRARRRASPGSTMSLVGISRAGDVTAAGVVVGRRLVVRRRSARPATARPARAPGRTGSRTSASRTL